MLDRKSKLVRGETAVHMLFKEGIMVVVKELLLHPSFARAVIVSSSSALL